MKTGWTRKPQLDLERGENVDQVELRGKTTFQVTSNKRRLPDFQSGLKKGLPDTDGCHMSLFLDEDPVLSRQRGPTLVSTGSVVKPKATDSCF